MPYYKVSAAYCYFAQGRRVRCSLCGESFVYIFGGRNKEEAAGSFLAEDDEVVARRDDLHRRALKRIEDKKKLGMAPCPHCGRIQGWMKRWVIARRLVWLLGLLLLAVVVLVAFLAWQNRLLPGARAFWPYVLIAALTSLLAICVFPVRPRQTGSSSLPLSMTDSQFLGFRRQCEEANTVPYLVWFASGYGKPRPDDIVVSLCLLDTCDPPLVQE